MPVNTYHLWSFQSASFLALINICEAVDHRLLKSSANNVSFNSMLQYWSILCLLFFGTKFQKCDFTGIG